MSALETTGKKSSRVFPNPSFLLSPAPTGLQNLQGGEFQRLSSGQDPRAWDFPLQIQWVRHFTDAAVVQMRKHSWCGGNFHLDFKGNSRKPSHICLCREFIMGWQLVGS